MAAAVDDSASCPHLELDKDKVTSHAAAMFSSSAKDPPGLMDTNGYDDDNLRWESAQKDQEIASLNAELCKWRQLHAMVSKDVRDYEAKLIEKSLECTILQTSLSEQHKEIKRLKSAMHKSQVDEIDYMQREKQLSEAMNASQARRKSLQTEISSLTVSTKKKDEDIDYLKSIVRQLRRDKRDLQEKMAKAGHPESEEVEVETAEQRAATDNLIVEYSKQIIKLQAENEKRTEQARENLSRLFAVQTQTEKLESKSKKNLRRLRRDQERLQFTVRALETCKSKLREKTKEVESLQGMEDVVSCDSSRSNFSGQCVVCHGREACVALLPCAHVCLCTSCAGTYTSQKETCPMCTQVYDDTLRIYLG